MRTIRRQGLALVSIAAALGASALLASPSAMATPTDPALLSNLGGTSSGGWGAGGSTYWVGNLVTASSGGTITAVTFTMELGADNYVGTAVRVFADNAGQVDFTSQIGLPLTLDSHDGSAWTYTGSVTVPAGPFWIGMSYTGIDGQTRDIAFDDSGANATGPWTYTACPAPTTAGTTCTAEGDPSNGYPDLVDGRPLWLKMAIYGVESGGSGGGGSGSSTNGVTRIEHLQQVPVPESGDCATVDDADFAWNTGLTGGWKPSWAQWASSGRGGPICTRMLVNTGQAWGLE